MNFVLCTHNMATTKTASKVLLFNLVVLIAFKLRLDELWVPSLFSTIIFDLQGSLFFKTMKKNSKLAQP